MEESIKIALVDDEELFRKGISMILRSEEDIQIIAEAGNGHEFLSLLEKGQISPDIVLMDLQMPHLNGIKCTEILHQKRPDIKVIALSSHYNLSLITNMLSLGVSGYLPKNSPPDEVITTIREISARGFYYTREVMVAFHNNIQNRNKNQIVKNPNLLRTLSEKEIEILKLICKQKTTGEIANMLKVSPRTVDGHRNRLLLKTGAKNVVGLVLYALENNFIDQFSLK